MRRLLHVACLIAATVVVPTTAWAGPITIFSGIDTGVASGSALPNANAAATSFRNAVLAMGQNPQLLDLESIPVGVIAAPTPLGSGVMLSIGNTPNTAISTTQNQFGTFNTTPGGSHFLRFTTQFVLLNATATATATFAFGTPIDAFGAYFTGLDPSATLTLGFSDGSAQSLNIIGSNSANALFFGFTDPGSGISSVTLTQTWLNNVANGFGYYVGVDDVQFAAAAVPEPASILLLGAGLAAVAVRLRPRRRSLR